MYTTLTPSPLLLSHPLPCRYASHRLIFLTALFMPQALPFYFLNQAVFVLATLAVLVYVVSVYLLPPFISILVSRVYITKL